MSAISAIYVLDQKGKVLISRDYRGDVPSQCVDRFVAFISGEWPTSSVAATSVASVWTVVLLMSLPWWNPPLRDLPEYMLSLSAFLPAEVESEADVKPIFHEDGISYSYVQYNNVYMLAISRTNTNAMSTLYFLHRLVDVFKFYFQVLSEIPTPKSCQSVTMVQVASCARWCNGNSAGSES